MHYNWHSPIRFVRAANGTVMSHQHYGVSNYCQLDYLFNGLFRTISKKTSKLSIALLALYEGNHQWSVDSPHKGPVMCKESPCHDVILFENKHDGTIAEICKVYYCQTLQLALSMEIGRAAKLPFNAIHIYTIQCTFGSHQFQNQYSNLENLSSRYTLPFISYDVMCLCSKEWKYSAVPL